MGKDKFVVLPLSLDGPTKPKVAPFYEDKKLTNLGIYFDKGRKAMQGARRHLLPTSILVDRRAASWAASRAKPTGTSPRAWR